jgi:hypothetical protein
MSALIYDGPKIKGGMHVERDPPETDSMTGNRVVAQSVDKSDWEQIERERLNRTVSALCDLYVTYRKRFVMA